LATGFYLVLSGNQVATQRSFIMIGVVLCGVLLDRPTLTMRTLTIAALVVLLFAPESIVHPSFQMSFAATLALIAGYERGALKLRAAYFAHAAANLARLSPVQQVARREEALRERARRLAAAGVARMTRARNALTSRRSPDRLERALLERFATEQRRLDHLRQQLVAFSPEAVLARGYSITIDAESGRVVRSTAETAVDRKLRIRLATGRLGARVEEVET